MLRSFMIGAVAAAALTLSTSAFAQGTAAEAKAMLEKTVAAIRADKAKTLDQINKGENGFLVGDLYPFCFNLGDAVLVAIGNPNVKQLLGKDARTFKDPCRAQESDITRRADRRDGGLQGQVSRRSLQLGRVDAAQMAPARRAHVVQLSDVGASG
jgi:hypothetical protein